MEEKSERLIEPLLDVETILPILGRISILGGLNERELHILFNKMKKTRYKKGEIIFSQGDKASYIYIIKKGLVKMYVEEDHTALELAEFGIGQCFGETSLIGIQPQSATIEAVEDSELIIFSGAALHSLYKEHLELFSKILLNIARETCRRLVHTDDVLLHYVMDEKKRGKVI